MRPPELSDRVLGVIAFPITPFHRDAAMEIDWQAFRDHVAFLGSSGISAVVVAGGTGEFFALAADEIVRMTRAAAEVIHGTIPIIASIGHSVAEARPLARAVVEAGADGLLIMPPYYTTRDAGALGTYYLGIAEVAPDTGFIIYARDHASMDASLLYAIAHAPNVIAVKDGQGSVRDFLHCRAQLGDRFKWIAGAGDDLAGAYATSGADAYTSSIACYDPELALRIWDLAMHGPQSGLDALLMSHVLPWYAVRRLRRGYEVSVIKAAVEALGGIAGGVRPPLANLEPSHLADVQALAHRIGRYAGTREQRLAPSSSTPEPRGP